MYMFGRCCARHWPCVFRKIEDLTITFDTNSESVKEGTSDFFYYILKCTCFALCLSQPLDHRTLSVTPTPSLLPVKIMIHYVCTKIQTLCTQCVTFKNRGGTPSKHFIEHVLSQQQDCCVGTFRTDELVQPVVRCVGPCQYYDNVREKVNTIMEGKSPNMTLFRLIFCLLCISDVYGRKRDIFVSNVNTYT